MSSPRLCVSRLFAPIYPAHKPAHEIVPPFGVTKFEPAFGGFEENSSCAKSNHWFVFHKGWLGMRLRRNVSTGIHNIFSLVRMSLPIYKKYNLASG